MTETDGIRHHRTDANRVTALDTCPACQGKDKPDPNCSDCFGTGQVQGDEKPHIAINHEQEQRSFAKVHCL